MGGTLYACRAVICSAFSKCPRSGLIVDPDPAALAGGSAGIGTQRPGKAQVQLSDVQVPIFRATGSTQQ